MNTRRLAAIVGFIAVLLAGGCGQKGPLFLPDKNKTAVKSPPAAPATVPAPADASVPTPPPAPASDKDKPDKNSDSPGS